jgi:uncharacterized membrane protein
MPEAQTLTLWPHQSLSPRGLAAFIGVTAVMFLLPLISQLGHPGLWVLLPFLLLALAGVWAALARNHKDRMIAEVLVLTPTQITLTRKGPRHKVQSWEANPHWARLTLHATAGPVPQYLTLSGNGREVELGAFLTEAERVTLKQDIEARLARL